MFRLLAIILIGGSVCQAADQSWRNPIGPQPIKIKTVDSSPADLAIVGPATGEIGKPVTLSITGLPPVDLKKTVGEQIEWVKLLRFDGSAPDEARPATLEKELALGVNPLGWTLRVTVTAPTAGVYVVVCDWNEPPYGLALHRLTVGGDMPPVPDDPIPPPPPPPDDPVPPPTAGLHVIVVDDENVRGLLPQSQINIFTSKKVVEYLDANCATASDGEPAYRFSSNDSLEPGGEARELELPVWVSGWDAIMKAIAEGKVKLPAWAISNGAKGVIEPLPLTVDAALSRLKEFER